MGPPLPSLLCSPSAGWLPCCVMRTCGLQSWLERWKTVKHTGAGESGESCTERAPSPGSKLKAGGPALGGICKKAQMLLRETYRP